jgi:ADP-heptose:LPS heptosyltransferase
LNGLRVGIAWQGNPKHQGDRQRSIRLEQFEPLAGIDRVHLVSLQQGDGAEQIATLRGRFPIYDPGPMQDFLEIAALMHSLDLIITIDTSIAHLAGALGLPTWVLLPAVPDWRWLLDRDDNPWYPTTRLFRQQRPGEWIPTIQRVAEELKQRADQRH